MTFRPLESSASLPAIACLESMKSPKPPFRCGKKKVCFPEALQRRKSPICRGIIMRDMEWNQYNKIVRNLQYDTLLSTTSIHPGYSQLEQHIPNWVIKTTRCHACQPYASSVQVLTQTWSCWCINPLLHKWHKTWARYHLGDNKISND